MSKAHVQGSEIPTKQVRQPSLEKERELREKLLKRVRTPKKWFDGVITYLLNEEREIFTPTTYTEAMKCSDKEKWIQAMDEALTA